MVNNKLKNIIVLKGMASNVVQEAIVILKPNVELEKMSKDKKEISNKKRGIISEAEFVIDSYIREIETKSFNKRDKKIEKKYKISKIFNIVLLVILGIIFISF